MKILFILSAALMLSACDVASNIASGSQSAKVTGIWPFCSQPGWSLLS